MKRHGTTRFGFSILVLCLVAMPVAASNYSGGGANPNDWFDPDNWAPSAAFGGGDVPMLTLNMDGVHQGNPAFGALFGNHNFTFNQTGATADFLVIGSTAGQNTFTMAGGDLTFGGDGLLGANGFDGATFGPATINHTGGTLKQVGGGAGFLIGWNAGATYNLSGGSVVVDIPSVGRSLDIDSPHGGNNRPSFLNITGTGLVDIKSGVNFRIGPAGVLDILEDGKLIWRNRTLADAASLGGTIRAKFEQVGPDVVFTTNRSPATLLVMNVNRDTGVIGISNSTGSPVDIASYSIVSKAGTMNAANWRSIADFGDSNSGGSIDPNDVWHEFSAAGSAGDLSEGTVGMATLANGATLMVDNGVAGAWSKYYEDSTDLSFKYLTGAGTVTEGLITFSGGARYGFGDLNFDRQPLNAADWNAFVSQYGSDLTGLSVAQRYRQADLNGDGIHSVVDFNQFKQAFDAVNGAGAFNAMLAAIPEPATALLAVFGLASCAMLNRNAARRKLRGTILSLFAVALVGLARGDRAAASTWTNGAGDNNWNNTANWGGGDFSGGAGIVPSTAGGIGAAVGAVPLTINQAGLTAQYMIVNNAVNITGGDFTYVGDGLWGSSIGGGAGGIGMATITQTAGTVTQTGGGAGFLIGHNLPTTYSISGGSVVVQSTTPSLSVDWTIDGTASTPSSLNISGNGVVDVQAERLHIGPQGDLNVTGNGKLIWRNHVVADVFSTLSGGNFEGAPVLHPGTGAQRTINSMPIQVGSDVHFVPGTTVVQNQVLMVNTSTGQMTLRGGTVGNDVNFYEIMSAANSLNPAAWASTNFDARNIDPVGAASNQSWSTLRGTTGNLTEAFLSGFSTFSTSRSESFMGYNTAVDARDLVMLVGTTNGRSRTIPVEYVVPAAVSGDFNGNGVVDAADYVLWRNGGPLQNDPTPGIQAEDYTFWRSRFGATTGTGSAVAAAAAVPEPAGFVSLLMAVGTLLLACRTRLHPFTGRSRGVAIAAGVTLALVGLHAAVAGTLERDYRLGDDTLEGAVTGGVVGSGPSNVSPGNTLDSFGPFPGTFIDANVIGSPTYVSVSDRPGATASSRGAAFNGTSDALRTPISMNSPSGMSNNQTFFPLGYLRNYSGIFAHGMQLWAKPTPAGLTGRRQDLIIDTPQHGIIITANNTWGLQFAGNVVNSQVPVNTVNDNGWTHVMQLAGFADRIRGRSSTGAALLVNGVAVAASSASYGTDATALSIGSNQANDGNFYSGRLDEVKLFLWGDNSGSGSLTQNWGALDLSVDNDWIRQELARRAALAGKPSIPAADINLDGVVSGNGLGSAATDDVSAFIGKWLTRNLVNNVQVGDWNSRQNGDLNYDGIVDLFDWQVLRAAHPTGASLDLGALLAGANVPEPSALVLAMAAAFAVTTVRRKRNLMNR